jgi:hypothetical protein
VAIPFPAVNLVGLAETELFVLIGNVGAGSAPVEWFAACEDGNFDTGNEAIFSGNMGTVGFLSDMLRSNSTRVACDSPERNWRRSSVGNRSPPTSALGGGIGTKIGGFQVRLGLLLTTVG